MATNLVAVTVKPMSKADAATAVRMDSGTLMRIILKDAKVNYDRVIEMKKSEFFNKTVIKC